MNAQKSGGGPVISKPTALARPENREEPQTAVVNVPPQRSNTFTSRTFRTTLLVTLGLLTLSAAIVGAGMLAEHIPSTVFGLGIVAVGIVCGAYLAVKT